MIIEEEQHCDGHQQCKRPRKRKHVNQIEVSSSDDEEQDDGAFNVRETVFQGSFLPITLLAHKGLVDVNQFIVDLQFDAKLIHYIGHWGKLKPLKCFVEKLGIQLDSKDKFGQTVAHYAARKGQLGCLVYLHDKVNLDIPNS